MNWERFTHWSDVIIDFTFEETFDSGDHFRGSQVDVFDDEPATSIEGLQNDTSLPTEFTGACRVSDKCPEEGFGVTLFAHIEDDG